MRFHCFNTAVALIDGAKRSNYRQATAETDLANMQKDAYRAWILLLE